MEPKLQKLPSYVKTETPPMIQHSAFPQFKIGHRYRGVYERAGFDVNLKSNSPGSDVRSNGSIGSPTGSNVPTGSNTLSNSTVNSIVTSTTNNDCCVVPSSAKSSKSFRESQKHTPCPVYENKAHSEFQPNTSQMPAISPGVESIHTQMSESQSQFAISANAQIPVVQVEHCDSLNNSQLPPPSDNVFTFIPQSTQNKNLKDLSLNLNEPDHNANHNSDINESSENESSENESYDTTSESSVGKAFKQKSDLNSTRSSRSSIKTDALIPSSLVHFNHGLPSPPPTSKSCDLQSDNSLIKKQRLSSALNDFRKDIEDHKNYIPKSPSVPNSPAIKEVPKLPIASPSKIGLAKFESPSQSSDSRFSYNQNYINNASDDTLLRKVIPDDHNIDPSDQFQNFRDQQLRTDNQLNSEYQNFLKLGGKSQPRDSLVSMVSSIISKDSNYNEDEDEDANEAMERQLEALKVGEFNDVITTDQTVTDMKLEPDVQYPNEYISVDESASGLATNKVNRINEPLPTFNIENIDDNDAGEVLKEFADQDSFDNQEMEDATNTTWESIKPLSLNHSEDNEPNDNSYNRKNIERVGYSNDNKVVEVKPLSPNDRQVEERLKNINFPVQKIPDSGHDNHKKNEVLGESTKYPSGKGPCRVCRKEKFASSKGPQKSVFSKAGELSGQWHRSCFTCAYSGCTVKFSKFVQCYVFDDNAFCHNHYHELNETLCQNCSNGIEGECVENELHQKWHLHCLRCHKCHNEISTDYYSINGASYCEADAVNIIKKGGSYEDVNGNTKTGGLTTSDKVEKRRTRIMYVE